MATHGARYRLRYQPVRDASRTVTVEMAADSATEVLSTIRQAEGWIYILSLAELPDQKRAEQTHLSLSA